HLDAVESAKTLSMLLVFAGQLPTNVLAITATAHASDPHHALSQISQVRVGVGVYKRMALFNHSCAPNAFVRFDNATLTLITSRDIAPHNALGDEDLVLVLQGKDKRFAGHLKTKDSFRSFFQGISAAHLEKLLRRAYGDSDKTQRRMQLMEGRMAVA
ncbi:hypothetical protein DYB32_010181, partial [Aphanomyces invadans]